MKNSLRCACLAAKSAPIAVGSLIAKTASIFGCAINREVITSKPPSRLPLAFWLWDNNLISLCFANISMQPFTRSCTAETGGPLMITTLPLPLILSVMV